jgi:glycosyltransferase involved in cell wall biosynthesis
MSNTVGHGKELLPLGKFPHSVSLLAWGYNEEELLYGFFDRAIALLEKSVDEFEIIFIDDGSTDATGSLADQYAEKEPRLRCIHNETNRNVGYSTRKAISEARMEYLFWQTVDWCYDISELRIFLELLNHFDVVQGNRPLPVRPLTHIPIIKSIYRLPTRSDNLQKAIVSLGNYYLIKILFGTPFSDFQNVTFYRTKFIQEVDLSANSSFANPECLLKAYYQGRTFIEVPIPFIPRNTGVAKGNRLTSIFKSIKHILAGWLSWGLKSRMNYSGDKKFQIKRVSNPYNLNENVLRLIVPLFKYHDPTKKIVKEVPSKTQ